MSSGLAVGAGTLEGALRAGLHAACVPDAVLLVRCRYLVAHSTILRSSSVRAQPPSPARMRAQPPSAPPIAHPTTPNPSPTPPQPPQRDKKKKKDKERGEGDEADATEATADDDGAGEGEEGSEEEEDDGVVWMADTSADAVAARAAEQLTAATAAMVTQGNIEAELEKERRRAEKEAKKQVGKVRWPHGRAALPP